jgi:tetratricopeptide (TPR) repeat protein
MAVAQSALGMTDDAAKTLQTLEERARALPSQREIRRVHWARGEIALLNHDTAKAVAELTKAVDMQPPRGAPIAPSWHAELWYAAALAHIAAGADAQAAPLLERLQSGHERLFGMEVWGRSFYQLGGIYERRGDQARAREQYARFVELWGDGDLEREWVLEARKRMGSR